MRARHRLAEAATDQTDARGQMETHYLRMSRLRQMRYDELRTLLAGDPRKAAPWIASAARYGLVEAQVRLGQMFLDGVGVTRDGGAGLNWFLCAARKGSPEAMNMVGRCYENGWGVESDLATAAEWYGSSAGAGHDWGEYNYANMLFDGRGVSLDREQALAWYRRASNRGHTRAMNLLARCYEEGWGTARNPPLAGEWYRRSAEGGYFRAQYNYATVLATAGRVAEAAEWFKKACDGATPASLAAMTEALVCQGDPRLSEIGRRYRKCDSTDDSDERAESASR
jgi:TPR repeat protein